jgi:hypothetical protein
LLRGINYRQRQREAGSEPKSSPHGLLSLWDGWEAAATIPLLFYFLPSFSPRSTSPPLSCGCNFEILGTKDFSRKKGKKGNNKEKAYEPILSLCSLFPLLSGITAHQSGYRRTAATETAISPKNALRESRQQEQQAAGRTHKRAKLSLCSLSTLSDG